jgi:hypothetical protein
LVSSENWIRTFELQVKFLYISGFEGLQLIFEILAVGIEYQAD